MVLVKGNEMKQRKDKTMLKMAEYIWLDGTEPTQQLRSKTRIVSLPEERAVELSDFPRWSFDGSSTNQAQGGDSDLILEPVNFVRDPQRGEGHQLVLCEVCNADGSPHSSNTRAQLRQVLQEGAAAEQPWFGFEQEYTLFRSGKPLGWPSNGFPAEQGPYYCGVGAGRVYGRKLVEAHTRACIEAGIMVYGINAEVMLSQWEFQIGYRGLDGESADPLNVSDHLWLARWLLMRLGEETGIEASFDPKPVRGDWNGAGNHTNFSTRSMRDPDSGLQSIREGIERLGRNHRAHIEGYGHGLQHRLTGLHETCAIDEFRGGVADRGASIRIPRQVEEKGYGYLEDRRPGANCDPYRVCALILLSVCSNQAQPRLAAAS